PGPYVVRQSVRAPGQGGPSCFGGRPSWSTLINIGEVTQMTAFIMKPYMQRWYRAALSGGPGSSAAQALKGETDGLALSFTDTFFLNYTGHYGSARVKDTSTPANNYNSHPFGLLTYAGASKKWVRGPNGLLIESDPALTLPYEWDENGNLLGVVAPEAQATNLALWSNDLTEDEWSATDITAAKTATGPDGVENSATTLTATAANGFVRQDITSTSAARITSLYIKRR